MVLHPSKNRKHNISHLKRSYSCEKGKCNFFALQIHHPRLRGPPRNGPIPHPPKSINELGKKKKTGPPNKLSVGARNPPPPPPPPRGTPPTPTVRTQSGADQQQLFRSPVNLSLCLNLYHEIIK